MLGLAVRHSLLPPLTEVRHGAAPLGSWDLQGRRRILSSIAIGEEGGRTEEVSRETAAAPSESGSPNLGRFNYHKSTRLLTFKD